MWRLAVRYEIGLDEIKKANPHIANPALIYPGDILNMPTIDSTVLDYEAEVVRLVNAERTARGLSPLTVDWQLPAWRAINLRICGIIVTFRIPAPFTARRFK